MILLYTNIEEKFKSEPFMIYHEQAYMTERKMCDSGKVGLFQHFHFQQVFIIFQVDCWRFFKCPPKISIWLFYIFWFFIEYLWIWIFSDFLPLSCFHFSPFYLFSVCWLAFVFRIALIYWPYVFAQSNPGYRFFKAAKIKHLVLSEVGSQCFFVLNQLTSI